MPLLSKLFGSKVTKKDGGYDFPKEAFAYVPDPSKPSTWKVRLWETPTAKETAGQVGRAAAALSEGGFRGNPAEIPPKAMAAVRRRVRAAWKRVNPDKKDSEMPDSIKMSTAFSIEDEEANTVWHYGKIFQAGSYPDKRVEMPPEKLALKAKKFNDSIGPVDIDIEHRPSRLDGKLGQLSEVDLSEDNTELFGYWGMPKWLDDVLEEQERTVSCTFASQDYPDLGVEQDDLIGLALVRSPRIEDAVLVSAFSAAEAGLDPLPTPCTTFSAFSGALERNETPLVLSTLIQSEDDPAEMRAWIEFAARHDTREGQSTIQSLHDTAGRYGAVCNAPKGMASQHEADALQQVHDITVDHGAACSDAAKQPSWMFSGPTVQSAATPPEEETEMTIEEIIAGLKKAGLKFTEQDPPPPADPEPKPDERTPAPATMSAAAQEELVRLREANRKMVTERITEKATAFAEKLVTEGRALPAEQQAIIAAYVVAAEDDLALPGKTFVDGTSGSRVEALERLYAARPTNQVDLTDLPAQVRQSLKIFGNQNGASKPRESGAAPTAERTQELLRLTSRGQAIIREQERTGRH